jgi:polysaccharide biosynthesis/export protein
MMKSLQRIVACALLIALASTGLAQEDGGSYEVQSGDVLQISVWKEADLHEDVLVRPDGVISFPLAGDITAAGSTVNVIRKTIAERLEKFIPGAEVTVAIKATAGSRFYVIGKVARQGEFPLNGPVDVLQALSMAGGGTQFADLNGIRILRRAEGKQIVLQFRYKSVASGRKLSQNILLKSGDTIVVP